MLNEAYNSANISINHIGTSRTEIGRLKPIGEIALRRSLRRSGKSSLNLYIFRKINPVDAMDWSIGQGTFPDATLGKPGSDCLIDDAVLVREDTLPGRGDDCGKAFLGNNAVHEVGHWFGLLHPWGNPPDVTDDLIEDTHEQAGSRHYSCDDVSNGFVG